jgi:coenzyme F420 hydrogenase subunit beta
VSVGDPWHNPPAGNVDAGRSLIIARSPAGLALIEAALAAGVLIATPQPRDVIATAQPNLVAAQGAVWGRRLAMRAFGLAVPRDAGLPLFAAWRGLPLRAKLSSVAGTARRILRLRLWQRVIIKGVRP